MITQALPAAKNEEHDNGDGEVEEEAGEKQRCRAIGQAGFLDDLVGDATIDADRRKTSSLGAVNDHQSHHDRADAVLRGKTQSDRSQNSDSRRTESTKASNDSSDEEHDPGYERHMSAHQPDGLFNQPVDRSVILGDSKKIGDADQR